METSNAARKSLHLVASSVPAWQVERWRAAEAKRAAAKSAAKPVRS